MCGLATEIKTHLPAFAAFIVDDRIDHSLYIDFLRSIAGNESLFRLVYEMKLRFDYQGYTRFSDFAFDMGVN